MTQRFTSAFAGWFLGVASCPDVTRGPRMGDTMVRRHLVLARHWLQCALCAVAVPGGRMAPRDAAPSLPNVQGPPVAFVHMHACHGAHACDPLSWARVFLFDTFTFPSLVPLASTIGHWNSDKAPGPSQIRWANVGVKCRASAAGHVRTLYDQLYC